MSDPLKTAIAAASARRMLFRKCNRSGFAIIVCKVCGWPHGESSVEKYAKEPFGCPDHPVRVQDDARS